MSKTLILRGAAVLGAAALLLAGCAPAPTPGETGSASDYCARMVTNSGGLEDRSFNQASWEGLQTAADEFDIDVKALVSTSETDLAPNVQQAVDSGCQFVLTVGYELAPATQEQAAANPDIDFAIVDDVVDAAERQADRLRHRPGGIPRRLPRRRRDARPASWRRSVAATSRP